jgi:hypothetical protein
MKASNSIAVVGAGLLIAAGGLGTAAVLGATNAPTPTRTVTINMATGPTGPAGKQGPTGPAGPAGNAECPTGFSFGDLVINHPGGQTTIFTCIKE